MTNLKSEFLIVSAILIILSVSAGQVAAAQHAIEISPTDEGLVITEGRDKVMVYQRKHKSLDGKYTRANYIHPLYGLDGQILTEDFPRDHLHHRGVFWAWHQLWLGDVKVGDPWATVDSRWNVYHAKVSTPDSESRALRLGVYWKSPLRTDSAGKQVPLVKETTTITVHRTKDDMRKIDFQIELLAMLDDMRLGGSEDAKGYGGFSTRIKLPQGLAFTGTDGPVEPTTLSLEAGPWIDISGKLGESDKISGLAILVHSSNPGYPHPWILRRKGSCQNAAWPGRDPVPLSREKPLVLRYRLIIHRGDVKGLDLDKLQAEYNSGE
ncbi:MAG TPA: hypothetical protein ENI81_08650 [Phycisphaerales bacterium]|mgnify:CR=1 FL=1|nr:hypothetical protein [Phycisphaerales bacterium]